MRFLIDECTGTRVAKWLMAEGYEVYDVYRVARGMQDEAILEKAVRESWIVITNDKDFGELVYRRSASHSGVILLRLDDERSANKIKVLDKGSRKCLISIISRWSSREGRWWCGGDAPGSGEADLPSETPSARRSSRWPVG